MMPKYRLLTIVTLAAALTGCVTPVGRYDAGGSALIDGRLDAIGQSSRVRYLVLHYTVSNLERSLALLTRGQVSSHYLVTDEHPPRILQLVDESRAAWHAGASAWFGRPNLNTTSIGIEIVNRGDAGYSAIPGIVSSDFQPFTPAQMTRTTALVADIANRYGLAQENIVAHGDVAPQRKRDPGPLFSWRELAAQGMGRWFNEDAAAQAALDFMQTGLPPAAWFQAQLARVGYDVPRHGQWDEATRRVLANFQMHYRPEIYDGLPDVITAGVLTTLPTIGTAQGQPRLPQPPLGTAGRDSTDGIRAMVAIARPWIPLNFYSCCRPTLTDDPT